jgi:integrase
LKKSNVSTQGPSELPNPVLDSANVQSVNFLSGKKRLDDLPLVVSKDVGSHGSGPQFSAVPKTINVFVPNSREHRVCASTEKAKNLAENDSRAELAQREGTKKTSDIKGRIVEFLWHMEKENKSKRTIISYDRYLDMLLKTGADLCDPESVKDKIAKQQNWGENTRRMATAVYKSFATYIGIPFIAPRYRISQKLPFIPLESEIDALIVSSPKRLATVLQLLKEIPIRIGEALQLRWTDVDFERKAIIVNNTEKNGKPRAFKVSQKLLDMLSTLAKKNQLVFGKPTYNYMENQFCITRKRVTHKLQNPRIMQIHFHTLRHWKATMEYHKTRDILHVMNLLGHRNIESTLVYTQLISFESDEYHSAVANTVEEARKLLEEGFEYVCQKDDLMLFRKRK